LLKIHRDSDGISYWSIMDIDSAVIKTASGLYSTKCFSVCEGTKRELFSYLKCIDGHNTNNQVNAVLREIVADQVNDYRRRATEGGKIKCEITGEVLSSRDIHVDHNFDLGVKFADLKKRWMEDNKLTNDDIKLLWARGRGYYLQSMDYEKSWKQFHKENAVLRCIKKELNLNCKAKPKPVPEPEPQIDFDEDFYNLH